MESPVYPQHIDPCNGISSRSGCRGGFADETPEPVFVPDDHPQDYEMAQRRDEERQHQERVARVAETVKLLAPVLLTAENGMVLVSKLVVLAADAGLDRNEAYELACGVVRQVVGRQVA